MDDDMKRITSIENEYGLVLFGMGLTHLFDLGHRYYFESNNAEKDIAQIMANGKVSIMTPEFQCEIVRCAAALAQFSPWTLFKYIKKHMHISN